MPATLSPAITRLRLLEAELALEQEGSATPLPPPLSVLQWAERYRHIDGQDFSLARFAPLRDIYADDHPHIVVMKPAQRGVSEFAINTTLFALEHGADRWAPHKDGLNVGYVFPTQDALRDFSKERLSGLEHEDPHLAGMFGADGEYEGVAFKQVGRSYLYLRGGWSVSALLSFPADMIVLDEFDKLDPKAIALARRRMNASDVQREVDISTPTLPGHGVHAMYLQSDQRVYEQQCPACATWHQFDFFQDVRVEGEPYEVWRYWLPEQLREAHIRVVCPACRHELSKADRCAPGRWTPLAPEIRGIRGYHVPALAFPFVSLNKLAVNAVATEPSELEEFYRSDLGLPYQPGGGGVTQEILKRLSAELPNGKLPNISWHATTMGVDVGARFHYRITSIGADGWPYVRAMGAVRTWPELDTLLTTYHVSLCVVDALPELHSAMSWAEKHAGRVLRAYYPTNATALRSEMFRADEAKHEVQINRTMAMDSVFAAVSRQRERWPAAIVEDPEVLTHMTAPVRVVTTDSHGQPRPAWVHTQPDHGFHASVYDRIARAVLLSNAQPFATAVGGQRPLVATYRPR
jgi:hypothetical protein